MGGLIQMEFVGHSTVVLLAALPPLAQNVALATGFTKWIDNKQKQGVLL